MRYDWMHVYTFWNNKNFNDKVDTMYTMKNLPEKVGQEGIEVVHKSTLLWAEPNEKTRLQPHKS